MHRPGLPRLGADQVGTPVVLPQAVQFDFTSRLTGQDYRLYVSVPPRLQPGKRYPVLYVLDGYWYFHAAARSVPADPGDHLQPAIVVGLGYPTDKMDELLRRRTFDLVPPPPPGGAMAGVEPGTGGLDDFIRMLLEEVRPFVQDRYPVDSGRQAIFGMSNGGLAVLRMLFRHPQAFQTYIAASPAIFHHNRVILADEANFGAKLQALETTLRVLITTAVDEQYRGTDPVLLANDWRFVDNAAELADRLAGLNVAKLKVTYTSFSDENHKSVALSALSRGLRFALQTSQVKSDGP
ncbi:alpha/beta hydrolase [Lacunisphaera limnophila]|uniref:alpha/beta hydrolase n=1 Tax=Lacunisphaera limnophila TaxID=1838286 RepID=UPI0012FE0D40|nr:alpha/beta hydrolase-fold protein [Lacunisphaera limnophila]